MKQLQSADRGTENLPALAPPQDMGEALNRFVNACPTLQSRTYLANLRNNIVLVLNSALKNNAYTERYTHEITAYQVQAGLHTDQVIQLVSDDFCLGLSYIQQEKGDKVAKEYLAKSDVETCVRIGKQLRTQFEEQIAELREANDVLPPAKIRGTRGIELDKVSRPRLSHSLDLHVGSFYVSKRHFRHYGQMVDAQDQLAQLAGWSEYLKLADELKIDAPLCTAAYENGYDIMLEKHQRVAKQLGFLELAVFVSIFCSRHGVEPENPLTMPSSLYPQFEAAFEFKSGKWHIRQDEQDAYRQICKKMFASERAMVCLDETITSLGLALPESITLPAQLTQSSDEEDRQYARGLFPNPVLINEYRTLTPGGMADKDRQGGRLAKEFELAKPKMKKDESFYYSAREVADADSETAKRMATEFPKEMEWHTLIVDEKNPKIVAEAMNNLFRAGSALCRSIACHLLLLQLSTDDTVMNEAWTIEDILRTRKEEDECCDVLAASNSRALIVMKHLTPIFLTFFDDFFRKEDRIPIKKIVEDLEEQPKVPKVNGFLFWHPKFQKEKKNMAEDVAYALCDTHLNLRAKSIDYVIKRKLMQSAQDWYRLISTIKVEVVDTSGLEITMCLLHAAEPTEELANACLEQMAYQLQPYALFDELNKSIEKGGGSKDRTKLIEYIDIPMGVFLSSDHQDLRPPELWSEARTFVDIMPDNLRSKCAKVLALKADQPASTIFPGSFIKDDNGTSFVFTTKSTIEEDDLQLIQLACKCADHGLQRAIIDKALVSPAAIQLQLLNGILQVSDASALSCAILGKQARQSNDLSIVADLKPDQWDTSINLAEPYSIVNSPLNASNELRRETATFLQSKIDIPIAEL